MNVSEEEPVLPEAMRVSEDDATIRYFGGEQPRDPNDVLIRGFTEMFGMVLGNWDEPDFENRILDKAQNLCMEVAGEKQKPLIAPLFSALKQLIHVDSPVKTNSDVREDIRTFAVDESESESCESSRNEGDVLIDVLNLSNFSNFSNTSNFSNNLIQENPLLTTPLIETNYECPVEPKIIIEGSDAMNSILHVKHPGHKFIKGDQILIHTSDYHIDEIFTITHVEKNTYDLIVENSNRYLTMELPMDAVEKYYPECIINLMGREYLDTLGEPWYTKLSLYLSRAIRENSDLAMWLWWYRGPNGERASPLYVAPDLVDLNYNNFVLACSMGISTMVKEMLYNQPIIDGYVLQQNHLEWGFFFAKGSVNRLFLELELPVVNADHAEKLFEESSCWDLLTPEYLSNQKYEVQMKAFSHLRRKIMENRV